MIDALRYWSQLAIPEVGPEGQAIFADASVVVVGAGGLGCPVLTALAGAGIGTIGIIDNDTVAVGNLHRQPLYTEADIGQPKALVAASRLQATNSGITVTPYTERLTAANADRLLQRYNIVVDCSDNSATRYAIDDATRRAGKPFVYGAVRRFEGQVSLFNHAGGPSFRTLFPDESAFAGVADCAEAGIIGFTTAIIGSLQAAEVVKLLLGMETLSGWVLTVDLERNAMRKWKINNG